MAKMTPSKEKMRLAHKVAAELQKQMGPNLKAVFVYGSVAANMATPEADIDVLVVCRNCKGTQTAIKTIRAKPLTLKQLTNEIHMFPLEDGYFADVRCMHNSKLGKILLGGAIPIFGKEYAMQHQGSWNFPNAKTIKKKYFIKYKQSFLGQIVTGTERIGFKRRKSARIPHFKRK